MNREIHVRFWEGLGVRFPRATHFSMYACAVERVPPALMPQVHLQTTAASNLVQFANAV